MIPDLEAIVAADEEGRARVATAEQRRTADLASVCAECDTSVNARRSAAVEAMNAEIAAIEQEGRTRTADAAKRNAEYLQLLAAAGEHAFEEAVEQYTAIVLRP